MSAKWTEGPLTCPNEALKSGAHATLFWNGTVLRPDGKLVCLTFAETPEQAVADAHRFAAAPDLAEVARAYEKWEADLIMEGNWGDSLPKFTQALWDRFLEIQAMRNAALAKAGAT